MSVQSRFKLIVSSAIAIVAILFVIIIAQTVNIIKAKNTLGNQQQQIEKLEKKLDYYENKRPETDYEIIDQENN